MSNQKDIDLACTYLVKAFGNDWYNNIDLNRLDMGSNKHCLLSQLGNTDYVFIINKLVRDGLFSESWISENQVFGSGSNKTLDTELLMLWKEKIVQLRNITKPQVETQLTDDPLAKLVTGILLMKDNEVCKQTLIQELRKKLTDMDKATLVNKVLELMID